MSRSSEATVFGSRFGSASRSLTHIYTDASTDTSTTWSMLVEQGQDLYTSRNWIAKSIMLGLSSGQRELPTILAFSRRLFARVPDGIKQTRKALSQILIGHCLTNKIPTTGTTRTRSEFSKDSISQRPSCRTMYP